MLAPALVRLIAPPIFPEKVELVPVLLIRLAAAVLVIVPA